MDGLGAQTRGLIGQLAHQNDHPCAIALAALFQKPADVLGQNRAGLGLVGGDISLVGGQFIPIDRFAIDIDQRNSGILRGLGHRLGRVGVDRIDDDRIETGCGEVLDLAQLAADIVLGILDLDFDAVEFARMGLDLAAQIRQERVVEGRHGDAGPKSDRLCRQSARQGQSLDWPRAINARGMCARERRSAAG